VGPSGPPAAGEVHLLNTAGAMVSRQFMGWKRTDPLLLKQADMLVDLATTSGTMQTDGLYLRYFGTLAMFQMGGDWWKRWNSWNRDALIGNQIVGGDEDGSWDPEGIWIRGRRPDPGPRIPADRMTKLIGRAIAHAAASPGSRTALEKLAATLALTADQDVLGRSLVSAVSSSPDVKALVLTRIAMVHMAREAHFNAADILGAACNVSGRPANLVRLHVLCLRKTNRRAEALRALIADANEGRTSTWHRNTIASLLFDSASGVKEPVAFMAKRLTGGPAAHLELKYVLGKSAGARGLHDKSAAFHEQAWLGSGRDEGLAPAYYEALVSAGRGDAALEGLSGEARDEDRVSDWRMRMLARVLQADARWRDRSDAYADEVFGDHPRARAALKLKLIPAALHSGNHKLLARLYDDAYHAGGRPVALVRPYIDSLFAGKHTRKAAEELEFVVRSGFHTPWAFESLAKAYTMLGGRQADVARAVSCPVELYPRDVEPRIDLAAHYEKIGDASAALSQRAEAARIRPEDARLVRRVVDDALAAGRVPLAQEMILRTLGVRANAVRIWGPGLERLFRLRAKHPELGRGPGGAKIRKAIGRRPERALEVEMRWDRDGTDVDLHVVEPGGEECGHSHKLTATGGRLDADDRNGLGPETYTLLRAGPGKYRIDVAYFKGSGPVTVVVTVRREGGRAADEVTRHRVVLRREGERSTVTTVDVSLSG